MRMRLLLLGSDNALGQALLRAADAEGIAFSCEDAVQADSLPALLDTGHALCTASGREKRPTALVNLTHYPCAFQAQNAGSGALEQQLQLSAQLAQGCAASGTMLLQPSSYRVFDGTRPIAYDEQEATAPLCLRGQMLARMEQAVRSACPQHLLLRFGWLLDESPAGSLQRLLQQAAQGVAVPCADDRRGNPTTVDDAARVLLAVLKQLDCGAPLWGTYHYGGQEASTALALAQAILQEAAQFRPQLHAKLLAQPHELCADGKQEPQHAVLSCKKILATFGIKPRAWRTGLQELLLRFFQNEPATGTWGTPEKPHPSL